MLSCTGVLSGVSSEILRIEFRVEKIRYLVGTATLDLGVSFSCF